MSLLASLTGVSALRRAGRTAKATWRRLFHGPLYAARKARFAGLGVATDTTLPIAVIDVEADCGCRSCANFAPLTRREFAGYALANGPRRHPNSWSETAAVIDLTPFATFDAWRTGVSKRTDGKYHRSANKARRLGYTCRVVGKDSFKRSVYALTGSKLRRSKGLFVWAAIAGPRADLVDTLAPPVPRRCDRHWRQCWGCFRTTDTGEQLVAFAILIRSGDTVWVQTLIGHGAALSDGVTKQMIFEIMQWLLDRTEPATQGIDRLIHGSIEEGSVGLYDWKRYLGFMPMLLDFHAPGQRSKGEK